MSTTKTANTKKAAAPTLTKEQAADFAALAEAQERIAEAKVIKDNLACKYKDWIDQWEDTLRDGVKVGDLKLRVKLSRQFLVEKI